VDSKSDEKVGACLIFIAMKLTNRERRAKVRKRMQKASRNTNKRKGLHLKHT